MITQRELYETLRRDLIVHRDRVAAAVRPLNGAQLNEHPEPKGWSIAEVLEHLCITDEMYDAPFAVIMRESRPDAGAAAREWKPSFLGGLIVGALKKPRPVSAPKAFQPGPTIRSGLVDVLLGREAAALELVDTAAALDWRAIRLRSPVLPAWAPKLNLGDAFRIHVVHLGRHAGQIERVAGKLTA